jgi:hypothetical protein
MKLIDMEMALNPEDFTVSLMLHDIPLEHLKQVLLNIAEPSWRQNILDGINGALAAKEMGIASTERRFRVDSEID